MNSDSTIVLTTAYLAPIDFFMGVVCFNKVLIEKFESYNKQSYRNRAVICTAQGAQSLVVPIIKEDKGKSLITDVRIDYTSPWLQQHKRALISAYQSSPFFEYYQDEIFEILDRKYEYLFDLNKALLDKIIELLGISRDISFTNEFILDYSHDQQVRDCRFILSPKKEPLYEKKPYYQVFTPKQGFVSNLSIVDLLFNEGPESIKYLR